MRQLLVFESISIDGYFTDADGDMSWAHQSGDDPEFADFIAGNAGSGGELLLGRTTYDQMAAYWPTPLAAQQMPHVADGINRARKYVASRALAQPAWQNTHVLRGDLIAAVRELKASAGAPLAVLGSGSVAAQLAAAGLVDRYQFVVVPIALGGGRTAFTRRANLRLVAHRAFKNGNVVLTYAS